MNPVEMNLVSWMRDYALPLWAARGVDHEHGGFVEELKQDGSPSNVPFKRVRVQGRQLFSFSTAALLGWNKEAASIADQGYAFLKKTCRVDGGHWARRLTREGAVLDPEMDLYDTAFVVLGLATYYRLSRNREALELVKSTLDQVRAGLATPRGIGYRQSPSDTEALRQNPNMHWFETMLFCYEATKEPQFLEEVTRIYRLVEGDIVDSKTGALRELFDNQWKPVREDGRILVEPGHHYEWAWLLSRASREIKVNSALISRVLAFADKWGVNPMTGLVYDQVSDEGILTQPTHRLWVQTEALKAWLVRTDVEDSAREFRINEIEANLLRYYLTRKPMGSWCDRLDADGRVHDGPVPASSMYHIMVCVTELWAWRSGRAPK
jgi:mannose/cellobiose epimerase-like protein (N-acyl-D-glucosamine 2-epimerase family)